MTPQFPNEIIEEILLHLPPLSRSMESVRTLCMVGLADSRFLAISRLPKIWEPHYAARWNRSDAAHEESRKLSTNGNWWLMFCIRSRLEHKALDILDAIIPHTDKRKSLAVQLVYECGLDVWEAILEETTRVYFRQFPDTDSSHDDSSVPVEGLARQYWAREILGVMSRSRAVGAWLPFLANPMADNVSYEKLLGSLGAFFGEDIESIFEEFGRLTVDCREHLRTEGITEDSGPTEIIMELCAWMRQCGFVRRNTSPDPHELQNVANHLPYRVLYEEAVGLPMSLAYVFISIAQRLGLDARAVSFPSNVIVMVTPSTGDTIYVDLYDPSAHPVIYYASEVNVLLQRMGVNSESGALMGLGILSPTPPRKMLLRAVKSILYCIDLEYVENDDDMFHVEEDLDDLEGYGRPGYYAGYCATLLGTGNWLSLRCLFETGVGGPLDSTVVLKCMVRSSLAPHAREELDRLLAQQDFSDTCVPRTAGRGGVEYFVGMICRSELYDFVGVIKRWDPQYQCEKDNEWIESHEIDSLPRARLQPFYHCFSSDGDKTYIPEDLLKPIRSLRADDIELLISANNDLGRWFDGVEFHDSGAARFLLSQESRMLYPDDDMAGRMFLANQVHQ